MIWTSRPADGGGVIGGTAHEPERGGVRTSVQRVGEGAEQLRQIEAEAGRRGQAVPMPATAVAEIAAWMLTTSR